MSDIIIGDPLDKDGLTQLTIDMPLSDLMGCIRSWDAYQSEQGEMTIETVFFVMSEKGSGTITVYESDPSPPKTDYSMSDFIADEDSETMSTDDVVSGLIIESHSWRGGREQLLQDVVSVLTPRTN